MSKFVSLSIKILRNITRIDYLDVCDLNELRDAIFEAIDKTKNLNHVESWACSDIADEIVSISDEKILSANRRDLICMYDLLRDAVHTNGTLLDAIYPGTERLWEKLAYWIE